MRLHSLRGTNWVGAIATLGLLAGCTGTPPAANQSSIGAQGGSVALQTGPAAGTTIVVPANALASNAAITIHEGSDPTDLPSDSGGAAGPMVVFGPEGQHFDVPVAITLPTTDAAETIFTRPVGGTTWTEVTDATYDAVHHVISGHVNHFSEFVPGHHHHHAPACMTDRDCTMGQVCVAGACVATGTDGGVPDSGACMRGTTRCGGACVDLTSDPRNCGACGDVCPAGEACTAGVCGTTMSHDGGTMGCASDRDCAAGDVCVSGACVAAMSHDGGTMGCTSDSECPAGEACVAGVCGTSSHDGGMSGCRVDTDCAAGDVCIAGVCEAAMSPPDAGVCGAGLIACAGACVDLTSDPRNCGACGSECVAGEACAMGVCIADGGSDAGVACRSDSDCAMLGERCVMGSCH